MDRVYVARLAFRLAPLTLAALSAAATPRGRKRGYHPLASARSPLPFRPSQHRAHRYGRSVPADREERQHADRHRGRLCPHRSVFVVGRSSLCVCEVRGPPPVRSAGIAVSDVPAGTIPFPPRDECRCWQSGWQDFGFTARYNVINGAFALTPSVSVGVPSHDYEYRGEAVVGQRLKEVRISR